jgi:hypothetical protein
VHAILVCFTLSTAWLCHMSLHSDSPCCLKAFELRVRPALDSPTAAVDRLKMNIYTAVRSPLHFARCLGFKPHKILLLASVAHYFDGTIHQLQQCECGICCSVRDGVCPAPSPAARAGSRMQRQQQRAQQPPQHSKSSSNESTLYTSSFAVTRLLSEQVLVAETHGRMNKHFRVRDV